MNQRTAPAGLVRRIKAILMIQQGHRPVDIADALGVSDRWVRKWRGRWQAAPQLESLYERERPGRPPVISQQTRREVINIASSRPEYDSDSRRTTWSQEQIADELERKTAVKISRSSVQRILGERGQRSSRRRQ
ncbi:MAG TPA: helix-turn-helix domain-containing protein [Polyangiaceae bacterium]|nr:helix-turn-helix domain-containing protein [Polyangiaceae bacterium]HOD24606.1 helix-turn-helix domain-containing protein [Polyangiaceae bacterium]HOE50205.1 helix-turn-helix domain-containing protein [Polyangiaceae bacterium]HOH02968.1 helix-turn-helix domain-containing protein [Polyangiaceae bacterium]HOR37700.1 helix-turn-helix domain-containing protein [Polyangiaceae bacterium]